MQASTLAVLGAYLRPGDPVALVDFPGHLNAGDSLIWLGELAYLDRLDVDLRYATDIGLFRAADLRRRVPRGGTVLIHGGGNFGDRWTIHQRFREMVVGEFQDRHVIQLPQTLDFRTASGLARAQGAINVHPRMTILLRQQRDVALAREWFPHSDSRFCHDMALGIGRKMATRPESTDYLLLLRTDSESLHHRMQAFDGTRFVRKDWHPGLLGQIVWRGVRSPERVVRATNQSALMNRLVSSGFAAAATINLRTAVRTLSIGRVVVTDRLHAMILAALMGKPVVALDNANGKVGEVFRDYARQLGRVELAQDSIEAFAMGDALLHSL